MKEFNLEQAKAGKPVITRCGYTVRIICWDAKSFVRGVCYPITALVMFADGSELIVGYTLQGTSYNSKKHELDLMMKSEKHVGWINIYPSKCDEYEGGCSQIYLSEAIAISEECEGRIATVKIKWED